MRYGSVLLLLLMSSAVPAAAQGVLALPPNANTEARMSADAVVLRLMRFDRNGDFKIAIDELPERMQTLVVRGDKTDDLMLDAREVRRMTEFGPEMPILFPSPQRGSYGFGDAFGTLSSRTHIENTIQDLRLAPHANEAAKRIGMAIADELEAEALVKADIRLDEVRRAALADRLSGFLTGEENENFRAALARRPLAKAPVFGAALENLRKVDVRVREVGSTETPVVR